MNDALAKIWSGSEVVVVQTAVGVVTLLCGIITFKVTQYFNDLRREKAIVQAVAAVQQTSPEGTPGEDKRQAALAIIAEDRRVGGKNGTASPTELEAAVNAQAAMGYRLHTITTAASGSKGIGGGDRIQATMVFEKLT